MARGETSRPASQTGPGSNGVPSAHTTASTVSCWRQPRALVAHSARGGAARPISTTAMAAVSAEDGDSNGGGRRTPGGSVRWKCAFGFAGSGPATTSRARRGHSGLRTPRVSPPSATGHASGGSSAPNQPATATGRASSTARSCWATGTDRTGSPAISTGKAGTSPAGTHGGGSRGGTVSADASGPTAARLGAAGVGSGLGPSSPAPMTTATSATVTATPASRTTRRIGDRGLVGVGATIIGVPSYVRRRGADARGANLRRGRRIVSEGAERVEEPVDVRLGGQVVDDPGAKVGRAVQRRRAQPAVARRLERGRQPVLVGIERPGRHRGRGRRATGQVPEADHGQLGLCGQDLEVIGLGAACGQVRCDVVVALHEPAEPGRPEVLPGRPQLECAEPPGPLEPELVVVQL